MKTKILTTVALLALALGTAEAFAAAQQDSESNNVSENCASILANPEGHSRFDVDYCRSITG